MLSAHHQRDIRGCTSRPQPFMLSAAPQARSRSTRRCAPALAARPYCEIRDAARASIALKALYSLRATTGSISHGPSSGMVAWFRECQSTRVPVPSALKTSQPRSWRRGIYEQGRDPVPIRAFVQADVARDGVLVQGH